MVKSVLGVNHQGLRDWVIQRVSAIYMAVYTVWLMGYFVCHSDLSYAEWHGLFSMMAMKVATLMFIAALLLHAWVGMWTVFTDYVKLFILRCLLNFLVFLMLVACFFWGLLILWGV